MTKIRICKVKADEWQALPLLASRAGWVQVDDGNGPMWVQWAAVHPDDVERLLFERLPVAE